MEAGGYRTPSLWLSDGWATVQREGWEAPGYWELRDDAWHQMTLHGLRKVEESARSRMSAPTRRMPSPAGPAIGCPPNSSGKSLRRTAWTRAARSCQPPAEARVTRGRASLFGSVWEWTQSAYLHIPATSPPPVPSANTTANSCAIRWSCAAVRSPRPITTFAQPTGTSSILISAGSSWACA